MNALEDALKVAVDSLFEVNGTEVSINGQRYTASINYMDDLGFPDFSERQKSSLQLRIEDFPSEPPIETVISETERGREHRIKTVKFQAVCWLCECEFRHTRHTGPFK